VTLANSGPGALVLGALLCASSGILAETDTEDEELPDLEFLEFLGIWDEDDYEWLLPEEEELADNDERNDPVPKGKESTETDDES
jgi:hypothetical protein